MNMPPNTMPSTVPPGPATTTTESLDAKGFIRSLYDFKFVSLIAAKWLKFVYAVGVVVNTVLFGLAILACLTQSQLIPVAIFLVPIYFLTLIALRIWIEVLIVFFRMGGDVHAIRLQGGSTPSAALDLTVVTRDALLEPAPTPAGWYDAPNDPAQLRYWDGKGWTDHHSPKASPQPT